MRRKLLLSIVALLAVILITIVTLIRSPKQKMSPPSTKNTKEQTVKIGIAVYPGTGPFYIAKEKGFFEKEGVQVEIVIINETTQLISALAGNKIQFCISATGYTSLIADSGIDIKEIWMSDISCGLDGLLVKNDVNSMNDLKGKTVYLDIGTPSHIFLRDEAAKAGLKKEDIHLVQMQADQVGAAFVAGKIDYGMTWDPWLSKASARKDGKVLFSSKDKPGVLVDTYIVRTDFLEKHRDQVKAIMRAWFEAVEFLKANPKEGLEIAARNLGLPVAELEGQFPNIRFLTYEESLAKFDKNTNLNIYDVQEKAEKVLLEDGVLKKEIHSENYIDSSVLKELYTK